MNTIAASDEDDDVGPGALLSRVVAVFEKHEPPWRRIGKLGPANVEPARGRVGAKRWNFDSGAPIRDTDKVDAAESPPVRLAHAGKRRLNDDFLLIRRKVHFRTLYGRGPEMQKPPNGGLRVSVKLTHTYGLRLGMCLQQ